MNAARLQIYLQYTVLALFGIVFPYAQAEADQVATRAELASLPAYCRGTQLIRNLSGDSTPLETYIAIYGDGFQHLHHFCWALNAENKSYRMRKKGQRRSKLQYAIKDIDYVIGRAPSSFSLLPEIYVARARILFKLDRDYEAVMNLKQAIELNSGYAPAYDYLSGYYKRSGDAKLAIATLEEGIRNTSNPDHLIDRLKELGVTYESPPEHQPATDDRAEVETPTGRETTAGNGQKRDTGRSEQSVTHPKKAAPGKSSRVRENSEAAQENPYCRFCPVE